MSRSLIVLAVLFAAGCATRTAAVPALAAGTVAAEVPATIAPPAAAAGTTEARAEPGEPVRVPLAPVQPPVVHFGFDSAILEAPAREALETFARDDLARRETGALVIGGHADERGTEEYNLVLSQKRAAAVRSYLAKLGIAGERLVAQGWGENRPAMNGRGELVWSRNRRAEIALGPVNSARR